MKMPLLISVPHAGLQVPAEVRSICALNIDELSRDGDEGSRQIYQLEDHVARFVTTDVARAVVDLNRQDDDFRKDGVIKTHTCWDVPVYSTPPSQEQITALLDAYYYPYHEQLRQQARDVQLCVDCHTMAEEAPPVAPDAGKKRPHVCLGDAQGKTLPAGWMDALAASFSTAFGHEVSINSPFSGGYITRHHGDDRPWLQLELSREPFVSINDKKQRVLAALRSFCRAKLDWQG